MFCPKCGSKNDDDAAFCGSCGNELNATQVAGVAKGVPAVTTTATGNVTTGDGTTAKAARRTGTLIAIVVAVIVVAIVAVGIITGGFGLLGPAAKGSVDEYSWEELSAISAEISKASDESGAIEVAKKFNLTSVDGKLDGTQTKPITLSNGVGAEVQITGFWHDDKTGGGKAGITFIFKDVIARHDMNSSNTSAGGWKDSQMRSWLASDGMAMLPDDLKGVLVEVDKKTNNVGKAESTSSVSTTADKLWLYSATELCGKVDWYRTNNCNDIFNAEGVEYKLYRDMNVNSDGANGILVKWLDGDSCSWWERSPDPYFSDRFQEVYDAGHPRGYAAASYSKGVVPGFCI